LQALYKFAKTSESVMSLQSIINERLSVCDLSKIASNLNYKPEKLNQRIKTIAESPSLGLDGSYYDFKYTQQEFVKTLCEQLHIPSKLYVKVMDDIVSELTKKKYGFNSFIFMETNFERKNQPIHVLAALEAKRYLKVDYGISKLPLNDQIKHIQKIICDHYKNGKSLLIWGNIKKFVYYHSEELILLFSVDGVLLDVVDKYPRSTAAIGLK
jgi:hypothetical protein